MSYVSIAMVDTDGSATDTLATPAFATTGTNRHVDVPICIANATATTVSSVSRGTETYTQQRADANPTGSTWVHGSFWMSTTEPQAASAAMTVVLSASRASWGFSAIVLDAVDQTTRIRGGTVTLNPDGDGAVSNLVLTTQTALGDLVVSAYLGNDGTHPTAATGGTESLRGSWAATTVGHGLTATAPGAASVTLGWNGNPFRFVHYAASHPSASTPPTNTVPTATFFTASDMATALPGMSVATGSSAVTLVTVSVPEDDGVLSFTASGSVVLDGNGTNSVTLTLGASIAEFNTVLGTCTFQGDFGVQKKVTVTLFSTDGTLTDSKAFIVFNDVDTLTLEGPYADIINAVPTLQVKIPAGITSDAIELYALDDDLLSDTETLQVQIGVPTANAGDNQSVSVGDLVQLDGSLSGDPTSDPLTYAWTWAGRPSDSTADFSDDTLVNPTFTPDKGGLYVAQLVVHDGTYFSDPDSVIVTASVTVPDVTGLTQTAATDAFEAVGLVLGTVTTAEHISIPAGIILSQYPTAGSTVVAGAAIDIEISIGTSLLSYANHPTVPVGWVISSNPVAGTLLAPGSRVELVISLGPA